MLSDVDLVELDGCELAAQLLSSSIFEATALHLSSNGERKVTTTGSAECSTFRLYSSSLDHTWSVVINMPKRKVVNVRHELSDRATSHAERYGVGKAVAVLWRWLWWRLFLWGKEQEG